MKPLLKTTLTTAIAIAALSTSAHAGFELFAKKGFGAAHHRPNTCPLLAIPTNGGHTHLAVNTPKQAAQAKSFGT